LTTAVEEGEFEMGEEGRNRSRGAQGARAARRECRRFVAVTVDDLPMQPPIRDVPTMKAVTERLLHSLAVQEVRAVGFVNEGALYGDGVADEERVRLLRMWLDAGHALGNHTFSHVDLNETALPDYFDDILRGERITRELPGADDGEPRYFRHPYLHTGSDDETKTAVEAFLTERGYTVAPVTVQSQEWLFAQVYDRALQLGDGEVMRRVGGAYVAYMEEIFEYAVQASLELFGYEIRQILLLHASALNADYFDDLARMLRAGNYGFVKLTEALEDDVYRRRDAYAGPLGWSWLHRWAYAERKRLKVSPAEPDFLVELYDSGRFS
jgi:peptidoglycan/xylan/chitin deacetylase (PgdA/CDA1 family)